MPFLLISDLLSGSEIIYFLYYFVVSGCGVISAPSFLVTCSCVCSFLPRFVTALLREVGSGRLSGRVIVYSRCGCSYKDLSLV